VTFTAKDWTGAALPALGMGCWAIGGPFSMNGREVGWGPADDDVSRAAIEAAFGAGLRVFDTAQAYRAGHSERLLGEVLGDRPEARIVTKVGLGIDPAERALTGLETEPEALARSLEGSRRRLGRDRIDLVLVHPDELSAEAAAPVFDWLETERVRGRIGAFGWSTDFPDKAEAFAARRGFAAVEFAANLFFRADRLRPVLAAEGLAPLVRSPLGMGLLAGRIGRETRFDPKDVRARDATSLAYFENGRPNPAHLDRIAAVRELLTAGGRSLAQGAISWLWALEPRAIPVPGMRTPDQVADLAGALDHGPLDADTFEEIEKLMGREPEGPPEPR